MIDFSKHGLRGVKGRIGSWHPAINRRLQKYFLDLFAGHTIVQGGAHVQPEFFRAIQGYRSRDHDEATRMSR